MSTRLERSRTNRVVGGVCGGVGEYLQIDALFVRVAFVILTFPLGIGLLIYIFLLFFMPNPGEPAPFVRPSVDATTAADDPAAIPSAVRVTPAPADVERRRDALGILLVAVGAMFLLGEAGFFRFLDWRYIWPIVVIALGVFMLVARSRR